MDPDQDPQTAPSRTPPGDDVKIDEAGLVAYLEDVRQRQNFPMGILFGAAAAVVAALIWGAVTVSTGYQIGYLALGVGFLVGFAVRFGGRGFETRFAVAAAVLALLGCVLGNLFAICGFVAQGEGMPLLEAAGLVFSSPEVTLEIFKETFTPMDLFFYAFAAYEGFRFGRMKPDADAMRQFIK